MKLIKRYISLLFFIPLFSAVLFAGAKIAEPGITARSSGDNVVITWQTLEETNLSHFIVQRKSGKGSFMDLDQVAPKSDQYYEFVDETAYKISGSVYTYRVAIVDKDGTVTYSKEVSVLHDTVNDVKKTWGSIKALFR